MASSQDVKHVISACADRLTALPNVVGVGLDASDEDDRSARVAVYVSRKVPLADLAPQHVVPKHVDCVVDGLHVEAPTVVREVGQITL